MSDGGVDAPGLLEVTRADQAVDRVAAGLLSELPPSWREASWLGLDRWQWVAIPTLAVLVAVITRLLLGATRAAVRRFSRGSEAWVQVTARLEGPIQLWWGCLLASLAVPLVGFTPQAEGRWEWVFRLGLTVAFFWGSLRAVSAWSDGYVVSDFARARPGSRALATLVARVARFFLFGFAVLTVLAQLGYSVTSVLAGLGIGGIALALGAQKTLENVFGAFALAVDQPIREGDFVRVDDFTGTVESIGLRSTRIRTLERTVVAIPNGKLADMRLETFAARDRMRFTQKVTLVYGTTSDQVKQVLLGFRQVLQAQSALWPEGTTVTLSALGASGLEIDVAAWFSTVDADVFAAIRADVLLGMLEVVEKAKTQLAYPTTTLLTKPA